MSHEMPPPLNAEDIKTLRFLFAARSHQVQGRQLHEKARHDSGRRRHDDISHRHAVTPISIWPAHFSARPAPPARRRCPHQRISDRDARQLLTFSRHALKPLSKFLDDAAAAA